MPRRRKGGSALMELARRRKLKAAKDKEGKLDAMVIKPALSRLRTGAVSKRKKGGQRLMEMSKKRRQAAEKRPGGKTYVTPTPKRKTAPKKREEKGPEVYRQKRTPKYPPYYRSKKPGVAPRTPSQRAADKKKLLAEQKKARKESANLRYGSEFKIPGLSKKDREGMEESVKFGAGGAGKLAAAGAGAGALKLYQMYKAKRAADLVKVAKAAKKIKAADRARKLRKLREAEKKRQKAQAEAKRIEQGYARQRESARAASRARASRPR